MGVYTENGETGVNSLRQKNNQHSVAVKSPEKRRFQAHFRGQNVKRFFQKSVLHELEINGWVLMEIMAGETRKTGNEGTG